MTEETVRIRVGLDTDADPVTFRYVTKERPNI